MKKMVILICAIIFMVGCDSNSVSSTSDSTPSSAPDPVPAPNSSSVPNKDVQDKIDIDSREIHDLILNKYLKKWSTKTFVVALGVKDITEADKKLAEMGYVSITPARNGKFKVKETEKFLQHPLAQSKWINGINLYTHEKVLSDVNIFVKCKNKEGLYLAEVVFTLKPCEVGVVYGEEDEKIYVYAELAKIEENWEIVKVADFKERNNEMYFAYKNEQKAQMVGSPFY